MTFGEMRDVGNDGPEVGGANGSDSLGLAGVHMILISVGFSIFAQVL